MEHGDIVQTWCMYEERHNGEKPPCIASCNDIECADALIMYEDGFSRFGSEPERLMQMPNIFSRDCDYISEEEYMTCRECYRYETCKNAYEKNKDRYVISTGIDELTSAIPKELH